MKRHAIAMIVVFITLYVAVMTAIVVNQDHTPIATQANRLCQAHDGVAQDGIESDYVICRDGFVAAR